MDLNTLNKCIRGQNLVLNDTQLGQLSSYHHLLMEYGRKMNLVSTGDLSLLIERHFLPSFIYAMSLGREVAEQDTILDFGSGAGFPGVILSIVFPANKVILLDASRKKHLFLNKVCQQLGLNAEPVCMRVEDYRKDAVRKVDIIVARAVSALDDLYVLTHSIWKEKTFLLTLKGKNYKNELQKNDERPFALTECLIPESVINCSSYLRDKILLKMELMKNERK